MCELFGLSSSAPVGMTYALHEFATHGGLLHRNKSGWGIAYRQDRVASVPLTEDNWEPLPEGTIVVLCQGREVARVERKSVTPRAS